MMQSEPAPAAPGAYTPPPPARDSLTRDSLTIAQLVISGVGMVLSLVAAGLLLLLGVIALVSDNTITTQATALIGVAWVALLVAVLSAPSVFYAIRRLTGRGPELRLRDGFRVASLLLFLWPLMLVAGNLLRGTSIAWLALPPIQILAVVLPLWWLVELARRKLPANSAQRAWGFLNFGFFITTPLAIVSEILVFLVIFIVVVAWITTRPDLMQKMEEIGQQVLRSQNSPEEMSRLLGPYLQNPLVVFGGVGMLSGLVPLMEEMLKPLALWGLARRRLTPAQGFAAGAICGASFALLESLLSITNSAGDGWLWLTVGRAGTGLLHITTTALVGWGLVTAWHTRRGWPRLIVAYLCAVALHGTWNFLSLLSGAGSMLESTAGSMRILANLAPAANIGLGIMVGLLLIFLFAANRALRREADPSMGIESGKLPS